MVFVVFYLIWRACTAVQHYLYTYMPTNIAIRWLKTRRGLKWAVPAAVVLSPAYFAAAYGCTTLLAHGGPGWANVLVVVLIWNGTKFAFLGLVGPLLLLHAVLSEKVAAHAGTSDWPGGSPANMR